MGTIAEKLQYTLDAINDIQQALIERGLSVADTEELATYADKIRSIAGGLDTSDATATAGHILSGKTAYARGGKITGAMSNNGSVTINPEVNVIDANTPLPEEIPLFHMSGYYDSIMVPPKTIKLSDHTPGTATANDIISGKTAFVNGAKLTGAIQNKGKLSVMSSFAMNTPGNTLTPTIAKYGAGYYEEITVNPVTRNLADYTQGTATANDISSGKTAYVNGYKLTGTKNNPKIISILVRNASTAGNNARGVIFNDPNYCTGYNYPQSEDAQRGHKKITFKKDCKVLLSQSLYCGTTTTSVTIKLNGATILTETLKSGTYNTFMEYEFNAKNGDILDIQYTASNYAYVGGQTLLIAE